MATVSSTARPRLYFSVSESDYILSEGERECYIESDTPLTDEHQQLFNSLYQYVQQLVSREEPWMYKPTEDSDEILVPDEYIEYLRVYAHKKSIGRHLKGSDYDLERAKTSFKTVVEWRIKESVDSRTYMDYADVLDFALIYCTFERDKLGHPIGYFTFPESGLQPGDWERVYQAAIFAAEKGAELSGERNLFQTTWILDFANLGYRTAPPLSTIREMIHLWTAYYPERLHRSYVVNAPLAFRAVWAIATRFLTENTKGKITMLDSTASRQGESFEDLIEIDSLHTDYGGNWATKYSFLYEENGRRERGEVGDKNEEEAKVDDKQDELVVEE